MCVNYSWKCIGILVLCCLFLLFATSGFTKLSFHLGWFNGQEHGQYPEPTVYKTGLVKDRDSYILRGPRSKLKQMELAAIPFGDQPFLKSIELSNVIVEPEVLLKSLERCENLESLKLFSVILRSKRFTAEDGFQSHVRLPKLKTFIFDRESDSEEMPLSIAEFQSFERFKTLLPFHGLFEHEHTFKNESGTYTYYREHDISSHLHVMRPDKKMKLNILDIRIGTVKLVQFNRMDGLLLSFLRFNNDILQQLANEKVHIRRLYLLDSSNVRASMLPSQLTAVFIRQNNRLPYIDEILEKLRKLVYLEELRLFLSNYEDVIDLAAIPRHIRHLAIGNATLVATAPHIGLTFPYLEKLGLTVPFIDDGILMNFPYIFPTCKQIALEFSYSSTSEYEERKLLSIVMSLPSIEVIVVRYFYSRHGRSSIHDPSIEYSEIESLLDRLGIPRDAIYFLLLKEEGRWRGHGLTSDDSKYLAGALSAKPFDFASTEFEFTLTS